MQTLSLEKSDNRASHRDALHLSPAYQFEEKALAIETFVYWDNCVFIHAIQRTPGKIEILEQILRAAQQGETRIVSSVFAMAEVVKCDSDVAADSIRALNEVGTEKLIVDFFENDFIELRPVDSTVTKQSRELTRKYGIKPPDAVHLATAMLDPRITHFHTYDHSTIVRRLAKVNLGLIIGPPSS